MIELKGDLFGSSAPAFGHGVNCAGVMGAGIAVGFRARWPQMYNDYRASALVPGGLHIYRLGSRPFALYGMASQDRPGLHARIEWVLSSASAALSDAYASGFDRIAVPRIGCGIGGLAWPDVKAALTSLERPGGPQFEVWTL